MGLMLWHKPPHNGECRCLGGEAATEYRLSRTNYVITLAIGDRWYPQLMFDAHDSFGQPLKIRSDHIYQSHMAGKPSPISVRGRIYRYFTREEDLPERVMTFQILDQSGVPLGTERIPFDVRGATTIEYDAI